MKLKVKKEEENLTLPRALYQEKILKDIYGISKARGIKIFTNFFYMGWVVIDKWKKWY